MEKYVEIRRWDNQEVIHSGYFISIKECLEDGVKRGISFYRADLRGVNLEGADLRGVNLEGADLTGVNLEGAYLIGVNFTRADLTGVNFTSADLTEANLKGVRLWNCTGNNKEIKNIDIFQEYLVAYTKDILQIGCEGHSIEEWKGFSDEEILIMDDQDGLDFWDDNKYCIFNLLEKYN